VIVSGLILLFALLLPLLSLARLTSLVTLVIFILINLSLIVIKRREVIFTDRLTVPIWVPVTGFILSSLFLLFQIVAVLRGDT